MDKSEQSTKIPLSWERILHMLVLAVAYAIAETVLIALIFGQILFRVVTREANEPMRRRGKQLSDYLYEILLFVSFNSDEKPFPFQPWSDAYRKTGTVSNGGSQASE